MKKLTIMVLAAVICLALDLPATAKIQVGGQVTFDWSYLSLNPAAAHLRIWGQPLGSPITNDGFESMNFIIPFALNRLNIKYTSDDETLLGVIEIRGGDRGPFYTGVTEEFWYAYIQWQITPTNRITFGRQTTNFARFWPNQWVGNPLTTIVGAAYGNVEHSSRVGIKGYWRISDMFGLVWGLWENRVTENNAGAKFFLLPGRSAPPIWPFFEDENKLPRIDLALPIRFPWGRIEPSFTWSRFEYDDQVPWEGDDSYNIWGVSIGTDASFGIFSFGAEITWGENLGGGSYRGAEPARPVFWVDSAGNRQVEDAEVLSWFVDVGLKVGRNQIHVMYGQADYENAGIPSVPHPLDPWEQKLKQKFYGISWRIDVAKGFIVRPELMFYDRDDHAKAYGLTIDRGKQWLLGLQFNLKF